MFQKRTFSAMAVLGFLALAPSVGAAQRVIVRPYYGFGYYHGFYPVYPVYPWPHGFAYIPPPITGELKLQTDDKKAMVYVDGGFLGLAGKFGKFDLRPGSHEIELRDAAGNVLFHEKVAITPGRTTTIEARGIAG